MSESNLILLFNAIIYIITFIYYQIKIKKMEIGSFILLFYSLMAVLSFFLYNVDSPLWNFKPIKIFPFIYLYIALMVSFFPLLSFSSDKLKTMKFPSTKIMNFLSITIIVVYSIYFFQIVLSGISFSMLFNADIVADIYSDKANNFGKTNGGMNIIGILYTLFKNIIWIVLMYNCIKGNKLLSIGLLFSLLVVILSTLSSGSRNGILLILLEIPFSYFIFKGIMTEKIRRLFLRTIICIALIAIIGLSVLSYGRFNNAVAHTMNEITLYYASSNFIQFNNYALDAGGCRYGDRVFPLVRVLLGLDTAGGFRERRLLFPYLKLDDSQFSFFVGEFVIDFGPYFAFIIIILLSIFFHKIISSSKYTMGHIIICYFAYRIVVCGFALFPYSEIGGNLSIIYTLFFAYLFMKVIK